MALHLSYGGSAAHRTLACPGNHKESEGIPRRPASSAAIDGSMHHEVMEKCQKEGLAPADLIGLIYKEDGQSREFTEDDLPISEIAYTTTNKLLEEYDIDEFMVEPFLQLVPGIAGGWIDLLGLSADRKTILQLDYKFGAHKVPVEKNSQCAHYCISSRADPKSRDMWKDVERIIFCIVQPRVLGVSFTWETDTKFLDAFEEKYLAAMKSTKLATGPHCRYCAAEPYCELKRSLAMASNLLSLREQEDIQAAADVVEEIQSWVSSVKEEMYWHLSRGVPISGWKVVNKKAHRKWVDAAATDRALSKLAKKDKYKTELLSPAQMEKVLKKKKINFDVSKYTTTKSSGTTLAIETDPRDAVIASDVQGHLADIAEKGA